MRIVILFALFLFHQLVNSETAEKVADSEIHMIGGRKLDPQIIENVETTIIKYAPLVSLMSPEVAPDFSHIPDQELYLAKILDSKKIDSTLFWDTLIVIQQAEIKESPILNEILVRKLNVILDNPKEHHPIGVLTLSQELENRGLFGSLERKCEILFYEKNPDLQMFIFTNLSNSKNVEDHALVREFLKFDPSKIQVGDTFLKSVVAKIKAK